MVTSGSLLPNGSKISTEMYSQSVPRLSRAFERVHHEQGQPSFDQHGRRRVQYGAQGSQCWPETFQAEVDSGRGFEIVEEASGQRPTRSILPLP
jgi:hypothetical protein